MNAEERDWWDIELNEEATASGGRPMRGAAISRGRILSYVAVSMPDGYEVQTVAESNADAVLGVLHQLKEHYNRHFRMKGIFEDGTPFELSSEMPLDESADDVLRQSASGGI